MTAKQLTDSILQMAIQGKLVPQDPNDEPASVLLERIREEKKQLVKEKKIKKSSLVEQPLSEEEKFYKIPNNWEWCRLGWIGDWGAGATPAKGIPEYYNGGTIPWLRTGELNNGYVYDSEIKVTQKALEKCSLRMCKKGDVLIAMYGATIGKVAIAGIELTTNQACCACTPFQVYNKYLLYFLLASKKAFIELGEGGAQPNISREKIVAFPFALPPLKEQFRIVDRIEEILPYVSEYGEAYEEASKMDAELPDKLKKSILQEAVMGKLGTQNPSDEPAKVVIEKIRDLRNSLAKKGIIKKKDLTVIPIEEDEIPFNIPDTWEWVRLNELLTIISDGTHKTPNYVPSGIPFLSVQNISSGKLSLDKIKYITEEEHRQLIKRVEPHKGDILLCRIGTLGKAIKIYWDFEFSIFVSLGLLRPVMEAIADYIVFCINSPLGTRWILENRVGGGTHTYKINLSDIPNFIIPLPPLKEQARIIDKIKEIFAEIDNMTSNNIIIKETEETEKD